MSKLLELLAKPTTMFSYVSVTSMMRCNTKGLLFQVVDDLAIVNNKPISISEIFMTEDTLREYYKLFNYEAQTFRGDIRSAFKAFHSENVLVISS